MSTEGQARIQIGTDYRSKVHIFGLPLVHIATGIDPETGRMRVAKGIIAIGTYAIGLIALGGVSFGGLCLGGVSIGLVTLGGLSVGLFGALGGLAISLYLAVGGAAISGYIAIGGFAFGLEYAFGGFAISKHPYGRNYQDPEAMRMMQQFLKSILGDLKW